MTTEEEALRLLFEADSYPCIGNTDWEDAADLRVAAEANATAVLGESGGTPQLQTWLKELVKPGLDCDRRDDIYHEVIARFGWQTRRAGCGVAAAKGDIE